MKVSIIIPNYNGREYIISCLKSIQEQRFSGFELIIIDNYSQDDSLNLIKGYYQSSNLTIIENTHNFGFSRAINQGIELAKGEFVFLVNNDIELDRECITELYNGMKHDEKIFSIQAKMMNYYNREIIDDAGDEYNILGWTKKTGEGKKELSRYNISRQIFSCCAGAAMYRKSILLKIGLFDENFFAYMEDVDIGYRANILGYENIYCPSAVCYHIGSATTGSRYNNFKIKLAARNNIYVPYKNMPGLQLLVNFPFLLLGIAVKFIFFTTKGYGKVYISGIKEGLSTLHKINRVKFDTRNIFNYFKVQLRLTTNFLKYLFN